MFDSDYHTERAIAERRAAALERGVELHIWSQKELENFLLIPSAIRRAIERRMPTRTTCPDEAEIKDRLATIADDLKEETFDAIAHEILTHERGLGAGGANKRAREELSRRWGTPEGRLGTVSGKAVFARLSGWAQSNFGVSLSAVAVARELRPLELPSEIKGVLGAIDDGKPFPRQDPGGPSV